METQAQIPVTAKLKMTVTRANGTVEEINLRDEEIQVRENKRGNDSSSD
ncbi:MAG: hypothetical protein WCP58_07925 [bacterium]